MKTISLQTYLADSKTKKTEEVKTQAQKNTDMAIEFFKDSWEKATEGIDKFVYYVEGRRYFGWSVRIKGVRGLDGIVDCFKTRAEARRYAKYLTNKEVGDPSTWVPSSKGGK